MLIKFVGKHGQWTIRSDLIETLRREAAEDWGKGRLIDLGTSNHHRKRQSSAKHN